MNEIIVEKPPRFILINDDEPEILKLLKAEFEDQGFIVKTTLRSKDALEIIENERPDLLITDIKMPEMLGTELIDKLLEMDIYLPIIVMSGHMTYDSDIQLFLEKPFDHIKLANFIKEHIDEITDMQLIKNISTKYKIDEKQVGKVIAFYPTKGWGLIRSIGHDMPVYVNAADVLPKKRFSQLFRGQVVQFELNAKAERGPRAEGVTVLFDEHKRKVSKENAFSLKDEGDSGNDNDKDE